MSLSALTAPHRDNALSKVQPAVLRSVVCDARLKCLKVTCTRTFVMWLSVSPMLNKQTNIGCRPTGLDADLKTYGPSPLQICILRVPN